VCVARCVYCGILTGVYTERCVCRERLVAELERTGELLVELGTDQTSCHNPFNGGYCPVQVHSDCHKLRAVSNSVTYYA